MKRTIALFLALALLSGCADSSAITAEALKKSKGKYYIGEVELTAHTDENYAPSINITQSYSMDFDGNGKDEHFVILRYLDIEPEFIPYETDCCVFVSDSGNAELIIPKSVDMRMGIIQGDGLKHIIFEGGCNNTTSFFSIYSVKDGKPHKELDEWNGQVLRTAKLFLIHSCADTAPLMMRRSRNMFSILFMNKNYQ